tara:strand:+ start:2037 stop:2261 length:225 start_codon:yes stop_codon:yes gene_type:complete
MSIKKIKTHIIALQPGSGFRECIEAECEETGEISYFLKTESTNLVKLSIERFIEIRDYATQEKQELTIQCWVTQ